MRVRVGAKTDVGVVRDQNEDGFLADGPLYAVADGMGGHQGGEVASRVALETVAAMAREQGGELDLDLAVRTANDAILERASGDANLKGMGTTLTIVRDEGGTVTIAHVGDSRAYLLRGGELRQLTEDHTLVHRMVTEGKLTEDEAKIHPHRSILTRALGVEPGVAVDVDAREVEPGDRIMLCSDGLTGMVDEARIGEVLQGEADPQRAADLLVEDANRAGGQDNITVVVLDFLEGEPSDETLATERVIVGGAGATETIAAAPATPRQPGSGRRWAIRILVTVVVLVAALFAARAYLATQWFVGVEGDRVALFTGIPTEVLGIELYSVVEVTDVPAADARAAAIQWRGLEDGITASSEEDARDILGQIREDVGRAP